MRKELLCQACIIVPLFVFSCVKLLPRITAALQPGAAAPMLTDTEFITLVFGLGGIALIVGPIMLVVWLLMPDDNERKAP